MIVRLLYDVLFPLYVIFQDLLLLLLGGLFVIGIYLDKLFPR